MRLSLPSTLRSATAKILGTSGENLAARFLQKKGFKILATNWKTRFGELDLIASAGDHLYFVEVKTRRSTRFGSPGESITAAKKARLERLGAAYLARHPETAQFREISFGFIGIAVDEKNDPKIEWLPDAFGF